jgi:hypothetical protein
MAINLPASRPGFSNSHPHRRTRIALIAVTGFSALNAIAGGIGLVVNGLGIPEEDLAGTPFDRFTVPGLVLAVVVGGSMLTALVAVLQRAPRAGHVAMVAGAVMLGWIVVQVLMISGGRPLQVAVALFSLATIGLGWALQKQETTR